MKRIAIGGLVAGLIYFAFQSIMWMGGFHKDFSKLTANSKTVLDVLDNHLTEDGLYMLPSADPNSPTKEKDEEELMTNNLGKPWAMIFYHKQMDGMSASYLVLGLLYALLSGILVSFVLNFSAFELFTLRFTVSMCFALFALFQGILDDMNWFSFPWHYIKAEIIDLLLGWTFSSLWLAWYFNNSKKLIL